MLLNSILFVIILLQGYSIYNLRSERQDTKEIRQTSISPTVTYMEEGDDGGPKGENRGV